jgi:Flp pilus assembly protein TadG
MIFDGSFRAAMARLTAFRRSKRANVAMIFALSAIPVVIAVGGGVDLARSMVVRSNLASALDAAGLAVGATSGLTQAQMATLAQQYFTSNYTNATSFGVPGPVSVGTGIVGTGALINTITVTATVPMPTVLMRIIGITTINVGYSSTVTWGQTKLWVSLVLDNTGSMSETDGTGLSKISALKTAATQMLTTLQNASANPGDVQVALVPFTKNVDVGTSLVGATWIDWTDFDSAPPGSMPAATVGPGSSCPYTVNNNGYVCTNAPPNNSPSVTTIPSSGTYKGYVCPGQYTNTVNTSGLINHYYNGCYNSVLKIPSCHSSCSYNHTWIPNAHSTWDGCIMDRTQNYDVSNTTPTNTATDFPAENYSKCVAANLMGLGYNWTALAAEVNSMTANGSTDQPVGLAWGWQAQTQGNPLNAGTLPANTSQIAIIVSDGLNTQDRWSGDSNNQSPPVDAREALVCTNMKAAGFIVYAVYVDLNGTQGNSAPLQACASDPSKYFDLTTSGQIITTLNAIGTQITQLRVAL